MGRPPITLTETQCQEVETLAALLSQEQIADYFGIARNTFRAICERDEEVVARYKKGKAKAIAHVANGLLQKARSGDTASSIFYLKTQAGWRETAAVEHSGPQGGPIALSSARERIQTHLDRMAERIGATQADDASVARDLTDAGGGRVKLCEVRAGTGGVRKIFTRP